MYVDWIIFEIESNTGVKLTSELWSKIFALIILYWVMRGFVGYLEWRVTRSSKSRITLMWKAKPKDRFWGTTPELLNLPSLTNRTMVQSATISIRIWGKLAWISVPLQILGGGNLIELILALPPMVAFTFWRLDERYGTQWRYAADIYNAALTAEKLLARKELEACLASDLVDLDMWANQSFQNFLLRVINEAHDECRVSANPSHQVLAELIAKHLVPKPKDGEALDKQTLKGAGKDEVVALITAYHREIIARRTYEDEAVHLPKAANS